MSHKPSEPLVNEYRRILLELQSPDLLVRAGISSGSPLATEADLVQALNLRLSIIMNCQLDHQELASISSSLRTAFSDALNEIKNQPSLDHQL